MLSAMGQEQINGVRIAEEQALIKDDIKPRASEKQQPDSVVMFDDRGYPAEVFYGVGQEGPRFFYSNLFKRWVESSDHFHQYFWLEADYDVKYNTKGLVESITYPDYGGNITDYRRVQFKYNANGYLLSSDSYVRPINSPTAVWKHIYQDTYLYDVHENWIGYRIYNVAAAVPRLETPMYSARVDNQGKIVYSEYNLGENGSVPINGYRSKFRYYIWYYSDGRTPDVAVENNTPVGNNNQGSFDVDVNIPVDSINNGSITVTFPEGFTLDDKNTSLTLDFAGKYSLTITKQENNSWLLEIKPKTTKSASLRAGEAKTMLHVAYKVDEKKQRGTYDILVNSILFESKGGNYYPEPAITVPADVARWGVGNELAQSLSPLVYMNAQTIHIQAERAEQISIYSITGSNLFETTIQPGLTTINAASFPKSLLIVKGSRGWAMKLLNR